MTIPEFRAAEAPDALREAAVGRLRKKRDLRTHVLSYVLVNLALTVIWLMTTPGGFYWPIFPLLGWGIGVAFHIWDVYAEFEPSEQAINAEMRRITKR